MAGIAWRAASATFDPADFRRPDRWLQEGRRPLPAPAVEKQKQNPGLCRALTTSRAIRPCAPPALRPPPLPRWRASWSSKECQVPRHPEANPEQGDPLRPISPEISVIPATLPPGRLSSNEPECDRIVSAWPLQKVKKFLRNTSFWHRVAYESPKFCFSMCGQMDDWRKIDVAASSMIADKRVLTQFD